MKQISRYKRSAIAAFIIIICGIFSTRCINTQNNNAPDKKVNFKEFAGSEACASCHRNIYDQHIHTAHYNTSRPASAASIKGIFKPNSNTFSYSSQSTVRMEKRDSGFYQADYENGIEKMARRFDIVIGSGTKGQTSVCWQGNQLYQLPVSYFTSAGRWSNSPGYPHKAIFNRAVGARCLECHSTYAGVTGVPAKGQEEFDRNQIIYGVDCERCHGPGAAHVLYQTQHPQEKKAKFIVNPAALSRQLQLDACSLCHGGKLIELGPAFEFVTGDKLTDYFVQDAIVPDPNQIDVHGNQYALLRSSKCFRMSQTLTCNTCHNTHQNERGKLELFSQRCISCHNNVHETGNGKICKMTDSIGVSINNNCINCHMPSAPSKIIAVVLPGINTSTAAYVRSHYIKIYPGETKKFLHENKIVLK